MLNIILSRTLLTFDLLGIIYASLVTTGDELVRERLEAAVSAFLETLNVANSVIWSLSYRTSGPPDAASAPRATQTPSSNVLLFPPRPHDIAFDDTILSTVKEAWEAILGVDGVAESTFLRFEERESEAED